MIKTLDWTLDLMNYDDMQDELMCTLSIQAVLIALHTGHLSLAVDYRLYAGGVSFIIYHW